jgi:hypothetical protein
MDSGGQIMLGTVKPLSGAAVAHDGKKTLAMLRRRPAEAVADLLIRLDAAIATAQSTGSRVDEINKPSSDLRYELQGLPIGVNAASGSRLRIACGWMWKFLRERLLPNSRQLAVPMERLGADGCQNCGGFSRLNWVAPAEDEKIPAKPR